MNGHEASDLFYRSFVLFHADCKKVRRHEGGNLISREVNPDLSQRRTFSDLLPKSRFTTPGPISLGDAVTAASDANIHPHEAQGKGELIGHRQTKPNTHDT